MSALDITGRDLITVEKDGEEIEVYNHVSVSRHYYVNSVNGYEEFEADIAEGDLGDGPEPDYITERVKRILWKKLNVSVRDRDIEVIDLDSDDITVYGGDA
jgi:hypothetical protein